MDEGWIITTAITLGIGVISYFLKRTMNQLDCTVQQLQKIERDSVTKADLKETTDELKKDINKIREDYTPKETHSTDRPNTSAGGSHTVVSGDTLWGIAKKYYGNGAQYTKIYGANSGTIEAAAKSHGKSSSGNGHWIYPGTVLSIPA